MVQPEGGKERKGKEILLAEGWSRKSMETTVQRIESYALPVNPEKRRVPENNGKALLFSTVLTVNNSQQHTESGNCVHGQGWRG